MGKDGGFKPKFNPWARGNRNRYVVTQYPNSHAPGLNLIFYSLMPGRHILPFSSAIRLSRRRLDLRRAALP